MARVLSLDKTDSLRRAGVTKMSGVSRFIACVALSVLLHTAILVVWRERPPGWVSENERASSMEVTLRPLSSTRAPSDEKPTPAETARPEVERSRLGGSSSTAEAAAQAKTRPDATGDQSAAPIDMEAVRRMVREIERAREKRAAPPASAKSGLEYDTPLGRAIEKAARADCRVAYAGTGLLAVLFLVKDAITDGGCGW
jgi:hypothetical protein